METWDLHARTGTLESGRLARHKALVRRYVEEVWHRQRLSKVRELIAPTFVYHSPLTQRAYPGLAGLAEGLAHHQAALPPHRVAIVELIAEGDIVAVRLALSLDEGGTTRGGGPSCTVLAQYRVANGKIADDWGYDGRALAALR